MPLRGSCPKRLSPTALGLASCSRKQAEQTDARFPRLPPCPPWLETPCSPWAQRAQARHCLELQGFRPLAAGDLDRGAEAVPGFRRIARGEELTANAVQLRLPPTFTGRAGVLERRRNRCQALLVAFFPPACLREKTPIVREPESCRGPQHVDAA